MGSLYLAERGLAENHYGAALKPCIYLKKILRGLQRNIEARPISEASPNLQDLGPKPCSLNPVPKPYSLNPAR